MSSVIGFRDTWPFGYRLYNVAVATLLLVALSPTILLLAFLLLITQGPNILYFGPRMGKNQRPFQIIKFRTLCPKRARAITADRTLPADANIETRLGKILREVRLDELPQLVNIIRGDMNICGPRPVRPEIAAIESRRIKGYEKRFDVRPGLIGPTQACFGHGASKRIRARMNNLAVNRPVNIAAELSLLVRIGSSILHRIGKKSVKFAKRFSTGKTSAFKDIYLSDIVQNKPSLVHRIDMSSLSVRGVDLPSDGHLAIRLHSGALRRARVKLTQSGAPGIFNYKPVNEVDAFVIERYALGRVIIPPRVAWSIETRQPELAGQEAGI